MHGQDQPVLRKTALEVQRAHDILGALLKEIVTTAGLTHLPIMDLEQAYGLSVRYSVLCWMLGHTNRDFPEYLASLERDLAERGVLLVDCGHLHYPGVQDDD